MQLTQERRPWWTTDGESPSTPAAGQTLYGWSPFYSLLTTSPDLSPEHSSIRLSIGWTSSSSEILFSCLAVWTARHSKLHRIVMTVFLSVNIRSISIHLMNIFNWGEWRHWKFNKNLKTSPKVFTFGWKVSVLRKVKCDKVQRTGGE